MSNDFYKQVELYYNTDAKDFDLRYWQNPVLQRIRQDFREEVKRWKFSNVLEVGFGTGIDLIHFAKTHPNTQIFGIDISVEMQGIAQKRIDDEGLKNVTAFKGSVEDIDVLIPDIKFDLVYVFFGALNTVEDLQLAAQNLQNSLAPDGVLVLSFVNKYYLKGIFIELLKLHFRSAFARLKPEWGGYSPTKYLPSKCYTPAQIKSAFSSMNLVRNRGYSILHPAWYYIRINKYLGNKGRRMLWKIDTIFNKSFLWKYGEYSLFVFQNGNNIS